MAQKQTPDDAAALECLFQLQLKLVRLSDEVGVKMQAGSDAGGQWVIPDFGLHQEFDVLEAAGLPPLHVLQITTLNGAVFLCRADSLGSVEPGKQADLVLLDANPVDSVQALHSIHAVVRGGRYHTTQALKKLLQQPVFNALSSRS